MSRTSRGLAGVAAALVLTLGACADTEDVSPDEVAVGDQGADDDLQVDGDTSHRFASDEFLDNSADLVGESAQVSGEVIEVIEDEGFVLDGDVAGDVLVVHGDDLASEVEEGDEVTVAGTIEQAAQANAESEFGGTYDAIDWDVFDGTQMILLESIETQ